MKIKIDKLDILFSEFIRKRAVIDMGGCEYCGKPVKDYKSLQCSHFVGRRKRATRYDPDNACGLCFSCHLHLGEHPFEHTEFFEKRLGSEEFDQLIIRGNTPTKIDRDEIEADLKEKLKLLEV